MIFEEPIVFELGSPGRKAYSLASCDVPEIELETLLPADEIRAPIKELPELSELDVVRHYTRLSQWNFSIDTNFYPLGSCTMKLNAAAEMMPITWPEFAHLHPFAPSSQTQGYHELGQTLSKWLMEITGLQGSSLQPN